MSVAATDEMCAVCFDVLTATLRKQDPEFYISSFYSNEPLASTQCPVFVTWKIGSDKDLRGCIGTFDQSTPIGQVVPKYALISALNDSRFPPVSIREIQDLHVSVSLLTNFTPIEDPLAWEVGKHGIEIEFKVGGRKYSGTFLPEVAKEQGWDQAATLVHLFRKAGYSGARTGPHVELVNAIQPKVVTYESSKKSMSYSKYLSYRKIN